MSHRQIPVLPARPRVHPVSGKITRSYSVGRQSFARACAGEILTLTITSEDSLDKNLRASLLTTMHSIDAQVAGRIFFERTDDRTLTCRLTPTRPGLQSFRAEFSNDGGTTWLRDNVPDAWILIDPPQVDALRVYTLIPTVSGSIADWTADLQRISDMGFNAIHLLPITAMDTSQSPYAARNLFAVDQSYLATGSKRDGLVQLEDFIAEAKRVNIRLVFDLVLNHVGVDSDIAKTAPDWIEPDQNQPDGSARAKYWSGQAWLNWNDLVLIDFEHPSEATREEIWTYMLDYALFWAKYASDTGGFVRFDNLHSSDPAFVTALTAAMHREYPTLGIIAEYFIDEGTLLRTGPAWGLNLNLATPWDCKFVPQLRDYLNHIHRVSQHIRYYMPITSHDSGSPAQEFGSVDSTIPRYVAAALLGTGATGITQGVEYGVKQRVPFIGRSPRMDFGSEAPFAEFISRVNSILQEFVAFRRGQNCVFVDQGHEAVLAAFRADGSSQAIGFLIACNFDTVNSHHLWIDLSAHLSSNSPFTCTELIGGQTEIFATARIEITLGPCGAKVFQFTG